MGSQVEPADIVETVRANGADAVLVSQVVTQRDAHLVHLKEVRDSLVDAGLRNGLILVGGGPRFSAEQAAELGYDKIFGRGTKPSEVASYLAYAATTRALNAG
jgi:beta-lysine 5,6-aminomutase beta subunit